MLFGKCIMYLPAVSLSANARPLTRPDSQIRMMFGNGLRPQIWEQFQKRFNIPKICEFYGSTEGNANIGQWTSAWLSV